MRIVVLTNKGSLFGKQLINELIANRIPVDAVVVISQPAGYYLNLFRSVRKRTGFLDAAFFSLRKAISAAKELPRRRTYRFMDNYEAMGPRIIGTRGTNSHQTAELLKELKPDLLLLGQTGIIRKHIIQIPRLGTLNAHPGILPDYRGIDCGKWAIYNDDFENIGCTAHWVDTGVDTGDILLVKKYTINSDETLETLEANLDNLAVGLLAKVVASMLGKKKPDVTVQSSAGGKQYYKMSRKHENIVRRKLSDRAESIKVCPTHGCKS
jgi:methionyl-tRNA formyltransferase